MKMRIKGNSIRLRLTKTETRQIAEGKSVEEAVNFGGGTDLLYRLVPTSRVSELRAEFEGREIRVLMPLDSARAWAASEAISIKKVDAEGPFLLIEKDFVCLKPRQHEVEDEADLFVNPNEAHGSCG